MFRVGWDDINCGEFIILKILFYFSNTNRDTADNSLSLKFIFDIYCCKVKCLNLIFTK